MFIVYTIYLQTVVCLDNSRAAFKLNMLTRMNIHVHGEQSQIHWGQNNFKINLQNIHTDSLANPNHGQQIAVSHSLTATLTSDH